MDDRHIPYQSYRKLGELGLPLPDFVRKALIKLKETTEQNIHIDADVMKIEEKEQTMEDE